MRKPITPNGSETLITDAYTGGQKGAKLPRYDLIPVAPLEEVAKLYGAGALKYEDRNWEKGYAWSLSYSALVRHLQAFWDGDDYDMGTEEDPGTERHHLAAVVFHAFALMEMQHRETGTDTRPVSTSEIDIKKNGDVEVASWSDVLVGEEEWRKEVPYENEDPTEPLHIGTSVMTLGSWEYEVTPGTIGEIVAAEEQSPGFWRYEVAVPTYAAKFFNEEEAGPRATLLAHPTEVIAI